MMSGLCHVKLMCYCEILGQVATNPHKCLIKMWLELEIGEGFSGMLLVISQIQCRM